MIDRALHWVGVFFLADFLTILVLAALLQIISRRGPSPARLSCVFGVAFYFGTCLALIYGGLWLMIRVAK